MMKLRRLLFALIAVLGACSGGAAVSVTSDQSDSSAPTTETRTVDPPASTTSVVRTDTPTGELCASVVGAEATKDGETWTFALTVVSDDISATEFGDSWELRTLDGDVLATRVLAHEHINEQPFTRSMSGIVIPDGVKTVIGVAHHNVGGYCGETLEIQLP
jgi:ABC-type oligopeptide transport system substrate-binding subunit